MLMPWRSGILEISSARNTALKPSRSATFQPPPDGRATVSTPDIAGQPTCAGHASLVARLARTAVSREHVGMRITMNDGVGLAVEVVGDGPGLMLLHGLGGAKEDFADHVPTL